MFLCFIKLCQFNFFSKISFEQKRNGFLFTSNQTINHWALWLALKRAGNLRAGKCSLHFKLLFSLAKSCFVIKLYDSFPFQLKFPFLHWIISSIQVHKTKLKLNSKHVPMRQKEQSTTPAYPARLKMFKLSKFGFDKLFLTFFTRFWFLWRFHCLIVKMFVSRKFSRFKRFWFELCRDYQWS